MHRTIVYILGTSFSGSSLLNSLFDAQQRTRGLGEAIHLIRKPTDAWCSGCQCPVDKCALQKRIDPNRFYQSVSSFYPETEVLVNSSKYWQYCFDEMPIPDESYSIRMIILSKSLEEFAQSYATHNECSFQQAFNIWVHFHEQLLSNLDHVTGGFSLDGNAAGLCNRVLASDIAYVAYRQLASMTDTTMHGLCDRLSLPFDSGYRHRLWGGDTCSIGGNNAVYAQRSDNSVFFRSENNYLGGKYQGRQGVVFCDQQWMDNPTLLEAAAEYRNDHRKQLATLENRLGHTTQHHPVSTP